MQSYGWVPMIQGIHWWYYKQESKCPWSGGWRNTLRRSEIRSWSDGGLICPFFLRCNSQFRVFFFFLKFCVLASSSNLLHNGASKCALPYFQTTGCGNFSICQSRLGLALILVLWYELHPELLPAPSWTLGTSTQSAVVDSVGNINATACLQPH